MFQACDGLSLMTDLKAGLFRVRCIHPVDMTKNLQESPEEGDP